MSRRRAVIGPETFVGEPYELCPQCAAPAGLGLLMVGRTQYVKRCRACLVEQKFPLPPAPTPQVLYLDQFAVSNLARSLIPHERERFLADDPATQRGFWPRFFDRLDRLVSLGLLVCPPSSVHRAEAIMDDRITGSLERVHLHLSGEARFVNHHQVKRSQLYLAFCGWLDDVPPTPLKRRDVVKGTGEWHDRLHVAVRLEVDLREIDALRDARDAAEPTLQAIVDEWREQQDRSFTDRCAEQLTSFGPGLQPLGLMNDTRILLVRAMTDRGVPVDAWESTIEQFLKGEAIKDVPFARLGCGLFAALGWQAERAQGASIDRGMLNDFQAIATYAPYCDAMLIDRRCRRLMKDTPLRVEIPPGLQLFDVRSIDALEAWLEEIEKEAPTGHVELVKRVYGEAWLQPYTSLLAPRGENARPS